MAKVNAFINHNIVCGEIKRGGCICLNASAFGPMGAGGAVGVSIFDPGKVLGLAIAVDAFFRFRRA